MSSIIVKVYDQKVTIHSYSLACIKQLRKNE